MKRFSIYQYLFIGLVVLGGLAINTKVSFAADRCTTNGVFNGVYAVHGRNVDRAFWFDVVDRLNQTNYTEYSISDYAFVIEALLLWEPWENTEACWNPLATTWGDIQNPNIRIHNYADVRDFATHFEGLRATTATLSIYNNDANPHMWAIRRMFARQGFDENAIKNALLTHKGREQNVYASDITQKWKSLYHNWSYTTITSEFNGKVIDVSGWSRRNGATIHQWDWHGGDNQQWHLKDEGNGYYSIISLNSGKCLDVSGWSRNNGDIVHQWNCHGGSNQHWKLKKDFRSGKYRIVSQYSDKCLDIKDWSRDNGGQLHQWRCTGNSNQLWSLSVP